MNIQEAKNQIKHALRAYFLKDEFGNYILPTNKQRPVFLLGAPGIGKTAIIEQIAQELGVGIVSYSMTHHTRQSALGLPFITKKQFGDVEYDVSEFTMSEIISTVYESQEKTGRTEGILFLDEINCVSETLMPAMLQFLQYKIFGRHQVPDGWIVVTAGNPSEYNRNARDFDIATWDRLRRVEVEPDFEAWRSYAISTSVHPSVISYLDIKRDHFYKIETTIEGKSFVTARGWDDLSSTITLYEKLNIAIDESLISQFIQNSDIAKHFSVYYDLFAKYRSGYEIDSILAGKASSDIIMRAQNAQFDERISLMSMLVDALSSDFKDTIYFEDYISFIHKKLQALQGSEDVYSLVFDIYHGVGKSFESEKENSLLSKQFYFVYEHALAFFDKALKSTETKALRFDDIKHMFNDELKSLEIKTQNMSAELSNVFNFVEEAFGNNNEMLILIGDLAAQKQAMEFINNYGSEQYFKYSEELMFEGRSENLMDRINRLNLSDLENEK